MTTAKQFQLLCWKNYKLQKRKACLTLCEILLPALVVLLLYSVKYLAEYMVIDQPTNWPPFTVDSFGDSDVNTFEKLPPSIRAQLAILFPNRTNFEEASADGIALPQNGSDQLNSFKWKLAYTPNNVVMDALIRFIEEHLLIVTGLAFETEKEMEDYLVLEEPEPLMTFGGIVVTSDFPSDGSLPDKMEYKIRLKSVSQLSSSEFRGRQESSTLATRWLTNLHFLRQVFQPGPRDNMSIHGGTPEYLMEGFLGIQRAFDLAVIHYTNSSSDVDQVKLQMQRMTYPKYVNDPFIAAVGVQLPFLIMLSFIIYANNIVKDVVHEKEKKLKESMKLMGLSNWLHWLAWFLKYFLFLTISSALMTLFLKLPVEGKGSVITASDGTVVFVLLVLYCISIILFCFAISVFFSTANVAAAAGGVLFFLSYVPFFSIYESYESLSMTEKYLSCLLPNCAMAIGFNLVSTSEINGVGIQWSNIATRITQDDDVTLTTIFIFLIVDSILASIITWYVDAVKPGDFGVPKPYSFPFQRWYWCGGSQGKPKDDEASASGANVGEYFEKMPKNITCGIQIKGLRKVFKTGTEEKVAVDRLYLDMATDQITALLGHNGAGKSTTMFMLTGFLPPSEGTATINGYNITTDIETVRKTLGLCPQHDVLFDNLTVEEHLQFFVRLKGVEDKQEVKKQIDHMISVIHLEHKRNAFSKTLSGGMKRKLSVGIALIGNSKVVILDEPTSGMDPEARRQTWDILQSQRAGRTIVLSTHFMDEADYLGDRIAIMAQGKLVCYGSSLFLKRKYGVGYHMIMVKEHTCDIKKIDDIIKSEVPDAKLESNISAELTYILPHESSGHFEALFTKLEQNKDSLGISSFGASVTTLEEVFLKVGEEGNADLKKMLQNQSGSNEQSSDKTSKSQQSVTASAKSTGSVKKVQGAPGLS